MTITILSKIQGTRISIRLMLVYDQSCNIIQMVKLIALLSLFGENICE